MQFFEKMSFFALDVIGDISFGDPFGYLSEDKDLYQYHKINEESLPVMNIMAALPGLARPIQAWPLRLLLPKEGDQVGFGRLMGYAHFLLVPSPDLIKHYTNSRNIDSQGRF